MSRRVHSGFRRFSVVERALGLGAAISVVASLEAVPIIITYSGPLYPCLADVLILAIRAIHAFTDI